jgi:N-acetyl-1-D-myo-inositol-2-amino-2-deoxy-alpha-D-glucopyranoside deacetylase
MNRQKTLIFFGAHPDDETFGMGATLTQYALAGVKVYYVCATRGEAGTVDPEYMQGLDTIADLRSAEMQCAAQVLGLAGVLYLGYRDSGMTGSSDNKNPASLMMAPLEEVTSRMAKIIRDLKPDVVITHDAGGGYGHPDHIIVHHAAVKAFYAAADAAQFPAAGSPFQTAKLYFGVRPHGFEKIIVKLMPLFGQNPHKFGRNKDIDLTKIFDSKYPIHAVIRLKQPSLDIRDAASACHASQGGGRPRQGPFRIFRIVNALRGQKDYFMRDYPPSTKHIEKDLFEGIN